LTDKLAKLLADKGEKIGVIATDPTSPFTNGAILGDRIRMGGVSENKNVFIRSMGTRCHLGGLSKATADALVILSAYGCTYIFVETVGVGQSEIDIVSCADTTMIVLAPGLGDDIQAIKAGVMEIGDLFAVNKADREGAERTLLETKAMLDFKSDWSFKPPVCLTVAETGEGVDTLLENIFSHRNYMLNSGKFAEKRGRKKAAQVRDIIRGTLDRRIEGLIASYSDVKDEGTVQLSLDPYSLAEDIINRMDFSK
jgi:LAO/AO transport system kinase